MNLVNEQFVTVGFVTLRFYCTNFEFLLLSYK